MQFKSTNISVLTAVSFLAAISFQASAETVLAPSVTGPTSSLSGIGSTNVDPVATAINTMLGETKVVCRYYCVDQFPRDTEKYFVLKPGSTDDIYDKDSPPAVCTETVGAENGNDCVGYIKDAKPGTPSFEYVAKGKLGFGGRFTIAK